GIGTSTPDRLFHIEVSDSATDAVTFAQRLSHISSGTVAAGFGSGIEIELENESGTNRVVASQSYTYSDATDTSEDADFVLSLMDGGTLSERLRLTSDGVLSVAALDTDLTAPTTSGT